MPLKISIITFSIIVLAKLASSQSSVLEIQITNQPQNQIVLGKISGDKFIPTDSAKVVNGFVQFLFPENSTTGMYRIIFGKTRLAEIMNEPPQQLDFIFNNEDILFETDFKVPEDSLKIIQSEENKVWFAFKNKEKELKKQMKEAEMEVDYFQRKRAEIFNNKLTTAIISFNQLQKEREEIISETFSNHSRLFASRLINMYHIPFQDGNLTKQQRQEVFKNEYFGQLDFNDETLMNTSVYTEKVFSFLMAYTQQGLTREQQVHEFIKAIDIILLETSKNQRIYEFILDYLVRGFEKLQLDNLITYIAEKYAGSTCQTDEKTTLERKLESQKMGIGTFVSDFTMSDINGFPVTLSQVQKDTTLLIFWASWCPHCNELIPQLKQWLNQQKIHNFEVIVISLDKTVTEWQQKIKEFGIESWCNISDQKGWDGIVTIEYNIYATPTIIIVDKNRQILAKPITLSELIKYLSQNLK